MRWTNFHVIIPCLVSNELLSVPQCLGSKCACPYGYKILDNRKMCGLSHISFPATGKQIRFDIWVNLAASKIISLSGNEQWILILFLEVFCDHSGIQCGTHATCVYNDTLDHSICVCIKGYVGDGFECEPLQATLWRGTNSYSSTF